MKCAIGLLVAAVVFSGCAHKKKKHVAQAPPPTIRPKLKPMTSVQPGYAESGKASWYGHPYHGRPAADGEIYDMAVSYTHLDVYKRQLQDMRHQRSHAMVAQPACMNARRNERTP